MAGLLSRALDLGRNPTVRLDPMVGHGWDKIAGQSGTKIPVLGHKSAKPLISLRQGISLYLAPDMAENWSISNSS
jgi:hypothetical protein